MNMLKGKMRVLKRVTGRDKGLPREWVPLLGHSSSCVALVQGRGCLVVTMGTASSACAPLWPRTMVAPYKCPCRALGQDMFPTSGGCCLC